jgi:hypothetical protein
VSDGWSFGGSILTFVFPMLLFIGVAVALYVLFTKPTAVPGRRSSSITEHPVSYTPVAGTRPDAEVPVNPEPGPDNPAPYDAATAVDGENAAPEVQE